MLTNTFQPFVFFVISTCDFVSNQLARLDLADAAEEAAELLLGHVLGQVIDDEVSLAVVIGPAGLHGRGAAATVAGGTVGCGGVRPVRHLRLHVADYLRKEWTVELHIKCKVPYVTTFSD